MVEGVKISFIEKHEERSFTKLPEVDRVKNVRIRNEDDKKVKLEITKNADKLHIQNRSRVYDIRIKNHQNLSSVSCHSI